MKYHVFSNIYPWEYRAGGRAFCLITLAWSHNLKRKQILISWCLSAALQHYFHQLTVRSIKYLIKCFDQITLFQLRLPGIWQHCFVEHFREKIKPHVQQENFFIRSSLLRLLSSLEKIIIFSFLFSKIISLFSFYILLNL